MLTGCMIQYVILFFNSGANVSQYLQLCFHCDLCCWNDCEGTILYFLIYKECSFHKNNRIDVIWLVLKVVALGFCAGKHSYLQSTWNVLDGVLVFVSLIDILVSLASTGGNRILGILRVLRLLRTLRPLRWVRERSQRACLRHGQSMKSAIQSLLPLGNKLKVSYVVVLSPESTR